MRLRSGRTVAAELRRERVRARYAEVVAAGGCCSADGGAEGCCDPRPSARDRASVATRLGYSARDLAAVPVAANLGLGCGNPTATVALHPRDVVLDLGSGAGIDCFVAARKVGANGHVIGVDMTPEMIARARANARRGGFANVEFRLGEIEHLPVADASVDVVLSNCAINLVPEQGPVYREAFRVLRRGGRLAVADLVATRPIPERLRADPALAGCCAPGALEVRQVRSLLSRAGFEEVAVRPNAATPGLGSPGSPRALGVAPADIRARKPEAQPEMAERTVLFVCVENACRSLMAEAMFNRNPAEGWRAVSAGTEPAAAPNPRTDRMLREIGLEMPPHPPQRLTEEMMRDARIVVTLGCLDRASCPARLRAAGARDWELPDPGPLDDPAFREVRRKLQARVEGLRRELTLAGARRSALVPRP